MFEQTVDAPAWQLQISPHRRYAGMQSGRLLPGQHQIIEQRACAILTDPAANVLHRPGHFLQFHQPCGIDGVARNGVVIPEGRPNPGELHTVAMGEGGMPSIYRMELQAMAGTGVGADRILTHPAD